MIETAPRDTPGAIDAIIARALAHIPNDLLADEALRGKLSRVAMASDFALSVFATQPDVLLRLAADDGAVTAPLPLLHPDAVAAWPTLLRRYRRGESARLVWRDVLGIDSVEQTLAGSTRLADDCLRCALDALQADFARRHGVVRNADGSAQQLVVLGLGKLGGGELNFSSDVDLVYAYAEDGDSDGPRPLAAETWFARIGQQLAKLLDDTTADGFCHRVDLRLRPFGTAGRVALPFAAMEAYFQREGRDWERYAWQKARTVAGDIAAGEAFLASLRPFVYRRYLDFGALDGLRTMKAAIAAEVARKELEHDIKRGRGGIREIEFLAQALQLIHGGRAPALRERRLLPALEALRDARLIAPSAHASLLAAYRFLRRMENRLQMLRDAQTHVLPADIVDQSRIAASLGYANWQTLLQELQAHRDAVAAEFGALLAANTSDDAPDNIAAYWRALPERGDSAALAACGFEPAATDVLLRDFARTAGVRDLSDSARARLDRIVPGLVEAAGRSGDPLLVLRRVLAMLQNILRRTSYLALLHEQPAALTRLVDAVVRSAFLAERLAALPLLLDELLDARVAGPLPTQDSVAPACQAALSHSDVEGALTALNETRQSLSFRIALATLDGRQPARDSTQQLALLADAVLDVVLSLARREVAASHGNIESARFAIVGYGSLGGGELGFGSDLDLVFVYDAPADAASNGARPLDAPRWFARLAQKIVALLGAVTAGGRLYDVDIRLRPDGGSGLLVSSLASYGDYQRSRAWTWEHQALVRARWVAGDVSLRDDFERVRADTLAAMRDVATLGHDVIEMRARMRRELDRSNADGFDLKQGEGGLVDLEFLLQYLVLRDASKTPVLLKPRATAALIDALKATHVFDATTGDALHAAHGMLLGAGLDCTLDRRRRWVQDLASVQSARDAIRAASGAQGLDLQTVPTDVQPVARHED